MKQIIEVTIKARKSDLCECETDMLAVGHFSDSNRLGKALRELDNKLEGAIGQLIALGDFRGKPGTTAVVYSKGQIGAKRVLLVGFGEKKSSNLDTLRRAAACAAKKAVTMRVRKLSLALHNTSGGRFDSVTAGRVMTEGIYFGSYLYDEYVTGDENGRPAKLDVELIDSDTARTKKLKKGLSSGDVIGRAQSYSRTLANRPANVINPEALAKAAKALAKNSKNLTCRVLDEKQLEANGMGGILAVGSGSSSPPRLIVLHYSPRGKSTGARPAVALVGKAITFDSGGISIKPSAKMEEMKLDKSGGIAVLGAVKSAAELNLPVEVYGIIPSAENLPSGTSYRPGDIVTTFSGKTVEVQNTDAEGRMILCDALNYAVKQKCDVIIDIATLTGACRVALGKYMAALMGNDNGLIKRLQRASEESGEKLWNMPSGQEYAEEMKSKIADLKNVGSKYGGACTAAAFLRQFVEDKKWAHLDIASVESFDKATEYTSEGASGFGVRLLTSYLMGLTRKK